MQNNNLAVFQNENFSVRTLEDGGEIWFVAKDVAQALGYDVENGAGTRIFGHIPEIWTARKRIEVRSENGVEQRREVLCLSEQGLYFFLGRSDKKAALPYQMWIAGEVVLSIRKHGAYFTPKTTEELIANPDLIIQLAQEVKAERAKVASLTAQAQQDRPKVIFADAVDASKDSILIGNLAKILCQNGVQIGQNRLFAWLREHGYLIACKGERWNFPRQEYVDRGYFEVKKSVVNNLDGSTKITHTPKVTGKGQIYFINGFLSGKFNLSENEANNGNLPF